MVHNSQIEEFYKLRDCSARFYLISKASPMNFSDDEVHNHYTNSASCSLQSHPTSQNANNFLTSRNCKRYTRSELHLLRNRFRSKCFPTNGLRENLISLGVWKVSDDSDGNYCGESGYMDDVSNTDCEKNVPSQVFPRIFQGIPQGSLRKNSRYGQSPSNFEKEASMQQRNLDHGSTSSAHLMPSFAKRRYGTPFGNASVGENLGNSGGCSSSSKPSPIFKGNINPRKVAIGQEPKTVPQNFEHKGENSKERDQCNTYTESDSISPVCQNPRSQIAVASGDRRIGSGRLLHCEANWSERSGAYRSAGGRNTESDSPSFQKTCNPCNERLSDGLTHKHREEIVSGGNLEKANTKSTSTSVFKKSQPNRCESQSRPNKKQDPNSITLSRSRRYHNPNVEHSKKPEWFLGGPTSQNDTIELHGFDDLEHDYFEPEKNKLPSDYQSEDQSIKNQKNDGRQFAKDENQEIEDTKESEKLVSNKEKEKITELCLEELNLDAILSMDSLSHSLLVANMPVDGNLDKIGNSRFSRWFADKCNDSQLGHVTGSEVCPQRRNSRDNQDNGQLKEMILNENDKKNVLTKLSQCGNLSEKQDVRETQRLMTNVEELEAQLRKTCMQTGVAKNSSQKSSPKHKSVCGFANSPQDTEIFKKLMQQLGSENLRYGYVPQDCTIMNETPQGHPTPSTSTCSASNNHANQFLSDDRFYEHMQQNTINQQMQNKYASKKNWCNQPQFNTSFQNSLQPDSHAIAMKNTNSRMDGTATEGIQNIQSFDNRNSTLEESISPYTQEFSAKPSNKIKQDFEVKDNIQYQLQNNALQTRFPNYETDRSQENSEIYGFHMASNREQERQATSPLPLAFTPTAVLRKMTAEKKNHSDLSSQVTHTIKREHLQAGSTFNPYQENLDSISDKYLKPDKDYDGKSSAQSFLSPQQMSSQMLNLLPRNTQQLAATLQMPRGILGGRNNSSTDMDLSQQHSRGIQNVLPNPHAQQNLNSFSMATNFFEPGDNYALNSSKLDWFGSPMASNHLYQHPSIAQKPPGRPILKGPTPHSHQSATPLPFNSKTDPRKQNQQKVKRFQMLQYKQMHNNQQQQMFQQHDQKQNNQELLPQSHYKVIPHNQNLPDQQKLPIKYEQNSQKTNFYQPCLMQQQTQNTFIAKDNGDKSVLETSNYQRNGLLSPTSNQLAQWFSPELLAQASAGKLPLLNMKQALSLEEFERSIQHSSAVTNN